MNLVTFTSRNRRLTEELTYVTDVPVKGDYIILHEIDSNWVWEVTGVFRHVDGRGGQQIQVSLAKPENRIDRLGRPITYV